MNRAERVLVSRLIAELDDTGYESSTVETLRARVAAQETALRRPEKARARLRSRPLRSASPKRLAERDRRAEVRRIVLERDGGCVAHSRGFPGPCGTRPGRPGLEVHEIASRGTTPGSHLDPDLCVAICPKHHDDITNATGETLARARTLDLRRKPTR